MQPPTAERVSAGQRLFAATLMSDVERLNSLDDAWTLFLSAIQRTSPSSKAI
jgi:hypothetical protein